MCADIVKRNPCSVTPSISKGDTRRTNSSLPRSFQSGLMASSFSASQKCSRSPSMMPGGYRKNLASASQTCFKGINPILFHHDPHFHSLQGSLEPGSAFCESISGWDGGMPGSWSWRFAAFDSVRKLYMAPQLRIARINAPMNVAMRLHSCLDVFADVTHAFWERARRIRRLMLSWRDRRSRGRPRRLQRLKAA